MQMHAPLLSTGRFPPEGVGQGNSGLAGTALTKLGVILGLGTAGAWDDDKVESPAVWWDPLQAKYGMVYTGYGTGHGSGAIGLAWADDPAGSWTKAGKILDGSGSGADSNGCTGPFIWRKAGVYHLFYIGLTADGYEAGTKSLCRATSTNLTTWTRHGAIITPSGSGWRSSAIWHPCVVKDGGTYYLFFNAEGAAEAIGYATSPDLETWTVDDVNSPVVPPTGGDSRTGDPSLYLVDGTWWMAYYTLQDGASDSLASASSFPTTWVKYDSGNPVLEPSESYDEIYAHKPYVLQTDDAMYHFYTAVGSGGRVIAVAVATA